MLWIRGFCSALILSLAFAFGMLSTSAMGQEVVVQGSQPADPSTIKSYFTGTDPASIARGVADLKATGMYSSVSARLSDGKILVTLSGASLIINRVAFEGNVKITSDQLALEIQSKGRTPYSETTAKGDIDRIKEAYRKYGRNEAQVTPRLVTLPNGRVDLVFKIDEGDKTGVREIRFVGNNAFSAYRLHGQMQTTEMNFLSFLKNSDVYDPDRMASDEEAIRRYYMRNGYADFRITNTDVSYQKDPPGYIVTITVDEGAQYHVSGVKVDSRIPSVDSQSLDQFVKLRPGDVYNATDVDKSTEAITRDVARRGYAFSDVRPHGDRNAATHEIALSFSVDDGPKVYIERIDVVGNTRTRDYVIRREFDIGEGDPYNHALIERAERRLNNLGYFKSVHISNRPGSSPDRVIVIVNVEDQPTGSISIGGGYSTTIGFLAEVAYTETNFLGRGQYVRASVTEGQYSSGWKLSFTEPYFLDQRLAAGFDVFHQVNNQNKFAEYEYWTTGINLRLGLPVTDEFTFQPNYSIYQSRIIIPNTSFQPYDDCSSPAIGNAGGWIPGGSTTPTTPQPWPGLNCLTNGEAPVAIKQAAAQGATLTSLVGFGLIYNSLDNVKNPNEGYYLKYQQDIAGLGGDSKFFRETFDGRYYRPLSEDFTGLVHVQAGQINAFGGQPLRIIDNFNLGPTLVRGFAPGGIGPRDISDPFNIAANSLGGSSYFAGSLEVQFPIFGIPREIGLRGAVFADAGTLFGYHGQTDFSKVVGYTYCPSAAVAAASPPTYQYSCAQVFDDRKIRSSAGVSLIWASPLGPIRLDYAVALSKSKYDQLQQFSFSGGATF